MIDTEKVRGHFPYLLNTVNGRKPVYFDSAATTHKPFQVINTISEVYSKYNAPVNRSAYSEGDTATQLYVSAHEKTARFISGNSWREIVFTKNTTEAVNLLAYSLMLSDDKKVRISKGDEIVLPLSEHHSDYLPWLRLAEHTGAVIKHVTVTSGGMIDLSSIKSAVTVKTKLICCAHVSNVLGIINPVNEIGKIAKNSGALFVVDATQSVPHMPVNVQDLNCDFFVFSGHKMLGPGGTGVLWGRKELLEKLPPFLAGGGMIKIVSRSSATWNDLPWKFEAGTPDMCGAVAFAGAEIRDKGIKLQGAIDYLSRLGMKNVQIHEQALCTYALNRLDEIDEVMVYGSREYRSGIISFNIIKNGELADSHVAAEFLSYEGIQVRAGGHCAYPLMEELGIPGTLRISFYIYNTKEEIDYFIEVLKDIISNKLL